MDKQRLKMDVILVGLTRLDGRIVENTRFMSRCAVTQSLAEPELNVCLDAPRLGVDESFLPPGESRRERMTRFLEAGYVNSIVMVASLVSGEIPLANRSRQLLPGTVEFG